MLLNDLYTVVQSDQSMNCAHITALIRLNPSHDVFKGHFPGNPILPGVCMIQIMKEILMDQLSGNLLFENLDSIKFLSVINPERDSFLKFDAVLKETVSGGRSFSATLCSGSVVFCRIRGDFRFGAPGSKAF